EGEGILSFTVPDVGWTGAYRQQDFLHLRAAARRGPDLRPVRRGTDGGYLRGQADGRRLRLPAGHQVPRERQAAPALRDGGGPVGRCAAALLHVRLTQRFSRLGGHLLQLLGQLRRPALHLPAGFTGLLGGPGDEVDGDSGGYAGETTHNESLPYVLHTDSIP